MLWLVFWFALRGQAKKTIAAGLTLIPYLLTPLTFIAPAIAVELLIPLAKLPQPLGGVIDHIASLWLIAALAWLAIRTVFYLRDSILARHGGESNIRARQIRTQIRLAERVAYLVILIVAAAAMLMTFERVRQVGISLLASAGIAGVVVGLAAQKTLGTLFAGIHIAVTQPIRLDDTVIIEGQFGTVEEITLTYAVVRVWDGRRLVVPITYFNEKPFENWTKTATNLIGTVSFFVDYTVPAAGVRAELKRVLDESQFWDKQSWSLDVVNVTEQTQEIRALMSAADSGALWKLRCEVREKILDYLQKNYPDGLPKLRVETKVAE